MTYRPRPQCEVEGCGREALSASHSLCHLHWTRQSRSGSTSLHADRVGEPSGHGTFGMVERGADWVLCHECGKRYQTLGSHLRFAHDMSSEEYRERHGLASGDQLMCQNMIDKIARESAERVGSDAWKRFEQRRDATIESSQKAATAASKQPRAGASKAHSDAAQARRGDHRCDWCQAPVPKGRTTCSADCGAAVKQRRMWRATARRQGEERDFVRRDGAGAQLSRDEVERARGLRSGSLASQIRRGQFPEHAGRRDWQPFWWESDLK